MRISDWSSDVCSSDLLRRRDLVGQGGDHDVGLLARVRGPGAHAAHAGFVHGSQVGGGGDDFRGGGIVGAAHVLAQIAPRGDRQSVVLGKSVSVSLDLGGRRIIKKKRQEKTRAKMVILRKKN